MKRYTLKTVNNHSVNQDLLNTFFKVDGGYTWEMHNELVHEKGTVKKTLQASIEEFDKMMTNCILLNSTTKQDYYASLGVTFRGYLGSYYFVLAYSDNYEAYISTTYTSLQELLTTLKAVLYEGYLLDGSTCELTCECIPELNQHVSAATEAVEVPWEGDIWTVKGLTKSGTFTLVNPVGEAITLSPGVVAAQTQLVATSKYMGTTNITYLPATTYKVATQILTNPDQYTLIPIDKYLLKFQKEVLNRVHLWSTEYSYSTGQHVKYTFIGINDDKYEVTVNSDDTWYRVTRDGEDISCIKLIQEYYANCWLS